MIVEKPKNVAVINASLPPCEAGRVRSLPAIAAIVVALVVGGIFRAQAARGELWLDELWSVLLVHGLRTPLEILNLRHDNNHLLNSLWIWFVPEGSAGWLYRLGALIWSLLLLIGIARWTWIKREPYQIPFLLLIALSYIGVLYGSEARGYSGAICCATLSYCALESLLYDHNDKAFRTVIALSILGLLSHAIFLLFLGPMLAWLSYLSLVRDPIALSSRRLIRVWLASLATIVCLLLVMYRGMEIGGGPQLPYLQVAANILSISIGGSPISLFAVEQSGWWCAAVALFLSLSCIELGLWLRSGDRRAILVAFIVLSGVAAVTLAQPRFILGRYFLIQIIFLYLLLARFLVRLMSQGALGKVIALVALTALLIGNMRTTYILVSNGRAQYRTAFSWMAAQSPESEVTVGGNQDFQNSLRLRFLGLRSDAPRVRYENGYLTSEPRQNFIIFETLDPYEPPPVVLKHKDGATYSRVRTYLAPPESGAQWYIYAPELGH